jgi:hypothetical protein
MVRICERSALSVGECPVLLVKSDFIPNNPSYPELPVVGMIASFVYLIESVQYVGLRSVNQRSLFIGYENPVILVDCRVCLIPADCPVCRIRLMIAGDGEIFQA